MEFHISDEMLLYSVKFSILEGNNNGSYAVDWRWPYQDVAEWYVSQRERDFEWFSLGPLKTQDQEIKEKAIKALLNHFGLLEFVNKIEEKNIYTMSPSELLKFRRKMEKKYNLKPIYPRSNNIGQEYAAEIVD